MKRIHKILEGFRHTNQVFEGVKNSIFKQEHVEMIANERWKICKTCEFLDAKGNMCAIPGTQPCCADCGCALGIKLRSLSSACGKAKWDAVLTEEQEQKLMADGRL